MFRDSPHSESETEQRVMNGVTDMNSSQLIIHNAMIVTMDNELRVFLNGGIVINNDRIIAVGQSSDIIRQFSSNSQEIIDLHGQFLLPGYFLFTIIMS